METYSQAAQDIFVYLVMKEKKNGTFIDIGTNDPIGSNNTYILEKKYNWKGLLVEYNNCHEESYKIHRDKSIYQICDARLVNYKNILDNNFPINIDYLQIDLDVDTKSTLDTLLILDSTIFDKYKFATITFEHDIYNGDYFDTRQKSRDIFLKRGYILVFPDVKVYHEGKYCPFEDWYVHPELVDMNYINLIKTNESLSIENIKNILINYYNK